MTKERKPKRRVVRRDSCSFLKYFFKWKRRGSGAFTGGLIYWGEKPKKEI